MSVVKGNCYFILFGFMLMIFFDVEEIDGEVIVWMC